MLTDAKLDDIEYTGIINEDAKEDIEIDTICGTADTQHPAARGMYINTSTGLQVMQLKRNDRVETAEQLLIGTLYSKYADRRTKLSGTASLISGGLRIYTEAMQSNKKFILLSDIQNAATDESEITIVELRPDEYES